MTLGALNKHPKLKIFIFTRNAKQAIASMSQTQYDAIIEMSNNDGVKTPLKQLKTEIDSASHDDSIKPFILLVVEQREEGLKIIYYKRQMQIL